MTWQHQKGDRASCDARSVQSVGHMVDPSGGGVPPKRQKLLEDSVVDLLCSEEVAESFADECDSAEEEEYSEAEVLDAYEKEIDRILDRGMDRSFMAYIDWRERDCREERSAEEKKAIKEQLDRYHNEILQEEEKRQRQVAQQVIQFVQNNIQTNIVAGPGAQVTLNQTVNMGGTGAGAPAAQVLPEPPICECGRKMHRNGKPHHLVHNPGTYSHSFKCRNEGCGKKRRIRYAAPEM